MMVIKSCRKRLAEHIAHTEMYEMHTKKLVRNPEGKRPCRRPRHKWEDNIRMDFREQDGKAWTRFIWLRIGINGKLL